MELTNKQKDLIFYFLIILLSYTTGYFIGSYWSLLK